MEDKDGSLLVWTDSQHGSALHDGAGKLLAKLRPLAVGGVSAQWMNGRRWDVSEQLSKVKWSSSKWFVTLPQAKAAVEAELQAKPGDSD